MLRIPCCGGLGLLLGPMVYLVVSGAPDLPIPIWLGILCPAGLVLAGCALMAWDVANEIASDDEILPLDPPATKEYVIETARKALDGLSITKRDLVERFFEVHDFVYFTGGEEDVIRYLDEFGKFGDLAGLDEDTVWRRMSFSRNMQARSSLVPEEVLFYKCFLDSQIEPSGEFLTHVTEMELARVDYNEYWWYEGGYTHDR